MCQNDKPLLLILRPLAQNKTPRKMPLAQNRTPRKMPDTLCVCTPIGEENTIFSSKINMILTSNTNMICHSL